MRRALTTFLGVVLLLVLGSDLSAATSKGEAAAVEEWVRILTNLRESNVALPITRNNLAVVFHFRDLPVLLKLSAQQNDYAFNLFMNIDGRGMLISPGFSCYVNDYMTFETAKSIHIFVKLRADSITMPVWTTLENLENAIWGNAVP
jgi:hypothetical protein